MNILISVAEGTDPSAYLRAVECAGGMGRAVWLPVPEPEWDGLILAGGGDVEPGLYGQENCGSIGLDPARDWAELSLLDAFAADRKPVLGICRGQQLVNVWAGGSLCQDLGEKNAVHRWNNGDRMHSVSTEAGLVRALYGPELWVNSAHHQSVERVGQGFRVTALSPDGVVEAMEHRFLPILTTQFHPERMTGERVAEGMRLFRWFLARCGKTP